MNRAHPNAQERSRSDGAIMLLALVSFAMLASSCGPPNPANPIGWQTLQTDMRGALLCVWGFNERDVYIVGADSRDGMGPIALRFDGQRWLRVNTSLNGGDLWWVYGTSPDSVFMVGTGGTIVRYNPTNQRAERMTTPGTQTIFGVWGASSTDVYAVGGSVGMGGMGPAGVVWHFDGTSWSNVATLPPGANANTFFKVWGSGPNDVWVVGENSTLLHWNGSAWSQSMVPEALRGRLFTIHGSGTGSNARVYAVGGTASGIVLELDSAGNWQGVNVDGAPRLNGVFVPPSGNAVAVGANGSVLHRNGSSGWHLVTNGPDTQYDFHSVWVDPTGAVWAVGGQIIAAPLTNGLVMRLGERMMKAPMMVDPELLRCPDTAGTICTWAGLPDPGFNGDGRNRRDTMFYWPTDVTFSPTGQGFVIDWNNHRIRRLLANDTFETVVGAEIPGDGDPMMADLTPMGAPGLTVAMNHPTDLVFDRMGNLVISAWHNHKIRVWNPTTGNVSVMIGRGPGFMGDDGPAAMARLKQPKALEYDRDGNLFIMDQGNLRIRRIAVDGTITTVAGDGMRGFAGDGGPPLMARFSLQLGENPEPEGALAFAPDGRLFVADSANNRIRAIDFAMNRIDTVVGDGMARFAGDDGPALMASISSPRDIEFGPDGNLYIADTGNHCVRMVDLRMMTIRSVAGRCGQHGYAGDRGPANAALFERPFGVAFDPMGHLYVSDTFNNRIRRVQR